MATLGPEEWALSWVRWDDSDRLARARALGIDPGLLPQLEQWLQERLDDGTWGFPMWFRDLDTARECVARFVTDRTGLTLLGVELPQDQVASVLAAHPDVDGIATDGIVLHLRDHRSPVAGGEVLGYEPLGLNHGSFHSWLCHDLEPLVHDRLGIDVDAHGLITSMDDAARAAALIGSDEVGAEPAVWRAWRLVRHPLS